ncbi:MAG: UDP-N-acetylglucosamine 2-epimerase (non-hydrolyzing) [Firmicutes bacterium]|nr:UDP-N-acetylglucosamine 2-epimerase (non-hydrolyzing) [Bacillota bacterium]
MAEKRVVVVVGTRPEAVKMAPVITALRRYDDLRTWLVAFEQHSDLLRQALHSYALVPDLTLAVDRRSSGLPELTAAVLAQADTVFAQIRPDWVVVQGDTTTAAVMALGAFLERIPVAHVEAGLRSGDLADPFPEELNRRLITLVSNLHFAPTSTAARQLYHEGISPERVFVTGNTAIDALVQEEKQHPLLRHAPLRRRLIVVTLHRRESWGAPLRAVCTAVRHIAMQFPDIRILWPVHSNPMVSKTVYSLLSDVPNISLTDPLEPNRFHRLLSRAYLVMTDSGGIIEEAPFFHIPVLIVREKTERPEAVACGAARLTGTHPDRIFAEATALLTTASLHQAMTTATNPFGDGRAGERIAAHLARIANGGLSQAGNLPFLSF